MPESGWLDGGTAGRWASVSVHGAIFHGGAAKRLAWGGSGANRKRAFHQAERERDRLAHMFMGWINLGMQSALIES